MLMQFALAVLLGYIIGSIPFGYLVSRRRGLVDIRQHGSGRTGATNVLRTAGKKAALLVAFLDLSKGAVAVAIAGLIVGKNYLVVGDVGFGMLIAQVLAALASVLGHIFPLFLRFRGGRGVATFFGGLAALCPVAFLFGGEVLILGVGLTKFASLGSIAGAVGTYAILVPLTIFNGFPLEYLLYAVAGTLVLVVMHRDNIARLIAGKERRVGERVEVEGEQPLAPKHDA